MARGSGPGCAPMSYATASSISQKHCAHEGDGFGGQGALGMWVLAGVSVWGESWGRRQAPAPAINGACAHALRASEEFVTATLPCRQARIIWIILLSQGAGGQGCPAGMWGAG